VRFGTAGRRNGRGKQGFSSAVVVAECGNTLLEGVRVLTREEVREKWNEVK
jgi:hypothetical protein